MLHASGSGAARNAPDVAHLLYKVGVGLAFVFERVKNPADEQDMELISRNGTQTGPAGSCLTLDERARPVESVEEVLRTLGLLLT